jgi:hypothetical protein
VQTLPVNMKFISATKHPAEHAGQLTWRRSLAAGRTDKFRVVGKVGRTPGQLLRLATIACADIGSSLRPIMCAAHSDELPAGAVAAARASHAAAARSQPGLLRPLSAALVLAVVAGAPCWSSGGADAAGAARPDQAAASVHSLARWRHTFASQSAGAGQAQPRTLAR